MHISQTWNIDQTRLLTRRELATVLADLKRKRSANMQRNLVIVRLACCCGLRVSEIGGLELDDVIADVTRPHLRLRAQLCVTTFWSFVREFSHGSRLSRTPTAGALAPRAANVIIAVWTPELAPSAAMITAFAIWSERLVTSIAPFGAASLGPRPGVG